MAPDACPLDPTLGHVADVLRAGRVLVFWELADEPSLQVALWADGRYHQQQRPTGAFGDWTASELARVTFASVDVSSNTYITHDAAKTSDSVLINEAISSEFKVSSIASAPISSENCVGRLFVLDKMDWDDDDLMLTEIASSRIGLELEHCALRLQLAGRAAAMERMRVARDLHDGVLQSLTAARLQLKAARFDDDRKTVIDSVMHLLLDAQRRIRYFIEERKLGGPTLLRAKMQEITEQNRLRWGCDIPLSVAPEDAMVPLELADQLDLIVSETIANAVRHGQASRVEVSVKKSASQLSLCIKDNGRGLPNARGVFTETELATRRIGPVFLRTRIAELNGSLVLSSTPEGTELRIGLAASRVHDNAMEKDVA